MYDREIIKDFKTGNLSAFIRGNGRKVRNKAHHYDSEEHVESFVKLEDHNFQKQEGLTESFLEKYT